MKYVHLILVGQQQQHKKHSTYTAHNTKKTKNKAPDPSPSAVAADAPTVLSSSLLIPCSVVCFHPFTSLGAGKFVSLHVLTEGL